MRIVGLVPSRPFLACARSTPKLRCRPLTWRRCYGCAIGWADARACERCPGTTQGGALDIVDGIVNTSATGRLIRTPLLAAVPDLLTADEWKRLVDHLRLHGRQSQVLECAFYDERDWAIARRLKLSEHTVHTYRKRLFATLSVGSMAQAIARAFAAYVFYRGTCERPALDRLDQDFPKIRYGDYVP